MKRSLGIMFAFGALALVPARARADTTAGAGVHAGAGVSAGGGASAGAGVSVRVSGPRVVVPVVPVVHVRTRPRHHHRASGQGLLIGGAITLGIGVASLVGGIELIKHTSQDALGVVTTVHGGVCIGVGLPLTIVGAVLMGTREKKPAEEAPSAKLAPRFEPTAQGFAIRF